MHRRPRRPLALGPRRRAVRAAGPLTTFAASALLAPEAVERYGDRMEIVPVEHGGHFYLRENPGATAALIADLGTA
jgi:hypothetical protein